MFNLLKLLIFGCLLVYLNVIFMHLISCYTYVETLLIIYVFIPIISPNLIAELHA